MSYLGKFCGTVNYFNAYADMLKRYDRMLAEEPDSSALLYLRGRLAVSAAKSIVFFDRAIAQDSKNYFPIFAKAFHLTGIGDFKEAYRLCRAAHELHPTSEDVSDLLFQIRFALKDFKSLDDETSKALKKSPLNWNHFQNLMAIKAAANKESELKATLSQYQAKVKKEMPKDPYQLVLYSNISATYQLKDIERFEQKAQAIKDPGTRSLYLNHAYLLKGDLPKAEAMLHDDQNQQNGYSALLYWLGWKKAGNSQKAQEWRSKAKQYFQTTAAEEKRIGELFDYRKKDIFTQLNDLAIHPDQKRILYAAFALMYPESRAQLLSMAKNLNYNRIFPYHFLEDTIKWMEKGQWVFPSKIFPSLITNA